MNHICSRFALVVLLAVPSAVMAQDRNALLLRIPTESGAMGATTGRAQPGVSSSSPIGFGPEFRDVFIGFGYQAETRYSDTDDGTASIGAGLGNATTLLGVELVLTSLSTVRSGFGERMAASVKVHRRLPSNAAIGVGMEGIMLNGDDATDTDETFFAALSKVALLREGPYFSTVLLNVGIGNGRFQTEDNFIAGEDGIGFFASAGLRVAPWLGAIADWTGQDLNLAASLAPIRQIPLVITPALVDVLEQAGDGPRFTVGVGLSWRF